MKFWTRLRRCFLKNGIEIPHHFSEEETIIRALFHPLFITSKYKLKPEAFLPSSRSDDQEQRRRVSVYRKDYSSDNACKNSAVSIKMKSQEYIGFVAFINQKLSEINELNDIKVKARLDYTPMDNSGNYRPLSGKVIYTTDIGFPMHAEILYDTPVEKGNPSTGHRLYADKLIEITKNSVYVDKNPSSPDWRQEDIKWKPI